MIGERPEELTIEEYALVSARVAVLTDRPRAKVLAEFGFSEAAWEETVGRWNDRMVDEIRGRAGSGAPIEERYPLSTRYAKAYADAVREAKAELSRGDEDQTVRIAPDLPPVTDPLSVLEASNRAAARR